MKKFISLVLVMILLTGLAACGKSGGNANNEPPVSPVQPEAPEPGAPQPPEPQIQGIVMELEYNEKAQVTGHITAHAIGGSVAWEYVTDTYNVGQCDVIQEIGLRTPGFMFIAAGSIYCLDPYSGEIRWVNEDFGGESASWDFDEEGNLFLTGYFGPWIFGVNPEGETIAFHDSMPEGWEEADYFWPASLIADSDGMLRIHYYSNDMVMLIDPFCGEVVANFLYTETLDFEFLTGEWVDNEENPTVTLTIYPGGSEFDAEARDYYFTIKADEETTYYYEGRFRLETYDSARSPEKDWLSSELVDTNDPIFASIGGIGDFIVNYSYRGDDAQHCICLVQPDEAYSFLFMYLDIPEVFLYKLSGAVG